MAVLAERLPYYREHRSKMSQHHLARLSGLSRKHISDLESGRNKDCKLSTVIKLAAALGINAKRLVGWEEVEPNLLEFGESTAREFMRQVKLVAEARALSVLNMQLLPKKSVAQLPRDGAE